MKTLLLGTFAAIVFSTSAMAQTRIGEVSTTWHALGANDKVVVDRYDDPKVQNASCYLSRAATGGLSGSLGMATDPNRFSIACRATGPVKVIGDLPTSEVVFGEHTSFFFKTLRVSRMFDKSKNVLVYLVWSTELIDGSPFNNVTAIAIDEK